MNIDHFLIINHKGTMETFDVNSLCHAKTNLFIKLGAMEDHVSFNKTINKLIASILNIDYLTIAEEDKLDLIFRVINVYYKRANLDLNNQEYCNKICEQIASQDYNREVVFQSPLVEILAKILSYGFVNMQMKYKGNKSLDYPDFINLLKDIEHFNIGVVKEYKNRSKKGDSSLNQIEYPVTNELILLMNIFSTIKAVTIKINNDSEEFLLSYLLLILNYQWLFTHVITVLFDISCPIIQKQLLGSFQTDLESVNHTNNNKVHPKPSFWNRKKNSNNVTSECGQLTKVIFSHEKFFNMISLMSHYILHFSHLHHLSLVLPDSFKREIADSLKKSKIVVGHFFHYLQIFLPLQSLISLSVEFNFLELSTFEIILGLINNNINLRHISISLFTKEEEYYNNSSICRTTIEEGIDLLSKSSNDKPELNILSNNISDDSLIEKPQILTDFECNLQYLFLLLQTKKTLESIDLILDIPGIISNNENQSKELKEFKIVAPVFRMDNRKYPLFEQFFDRIDLFDKNIRLYSMYIHCQILSLTNITNIISIHLTYLFIGDLDLDTLKAFISFYKRDDFLNQSKLNTLILSLNSTLFDYNSFKCEIVDLIGGKYPKGLRKFGLHCSSPIRSTELVSLMELGNGNQVEKYSFRIKQIDHKEYWNFDYDKYYYYSYDYSIDQTRNKWLIIQVLSSLKILNNKLFSLIYRILSKEFVIQKIKKKKKIEILLK